MKKTVSILCIAFFLAVTTTNAQLADKAPAKEANNSKETSQTSSKKPTIFAEKIKVTEKTETSVTLSAEVDPHGLTGSAWFEFKGKIIGAQKIAGRTENTLNHTITGLSCGSSYPYKVGAVNMRGPTLSEIMHFETLPCKK